MTLFYEDDQVTLHLGDSLEVLRTLAADSVDAVVCDPPYGLEFMGKEWDRPWAVGMSTPGYGDAERLERPAFGDSRNANCRSCGGRQRGAKRCACPAPAWDRHPAEDMRAFQDWCQAWATECLRVLKPGGYLLAFGGTRTVHRLTCGIEDAGFEIRDGIDWLYGSGFPKSLDVSKAIDKRREDGDAVRRVTAYVAEARRQAGVTHKAIDDAFGTVRMANHWMTQGRPACVPSVEQWERLRDLLGFGHEMDADVWRLNGRKGTPGEAWSQREVVGERITGIGTGLGAVAYIADSDNRDLTAPATDDARRWHGWGTALKPAREPIVVARKPLLGTVAANVLAYGTGALNIDATRTGSDQRTNHAGGASSLQRVSRVEQGYRSTVTASVGEASTVTGRWPTNVVLSHAGNDVDGDLCTDGCVPGCPVAELDAQSGDRPAGARPAKRAGMGYQRDVDYATGTAGDRVQLDSGGASRYFPVFRYEAKAPTSERPKVDGEAHATVKPLALMRWLVQLVTPPGGLVLEPFAGSGTTVEACLIEGYRCVAVEREAKYLPLIMSRITKPIESVLFGVLDECEGAP